MLTPPVLVRRLPVALVAALAGLAVSAGLLATTSVTPPIERLAPEPPLVVCTTAPPPIVTVFAQTSR